MRIWWWLVWSLVMVASQAHATDKGLFWRLESPTGVVSYLFGTMHTDDNRVTDFSANVLDAIKSSDVFMMEVSESSDPALFMLPTGTLAEHLTSDEFDQVRTLADFHVMHLGAAIQMKPWLLAVIFDLPKPQTPFAQDNLLRTKAEEKGKRVEGIETPQAHFGVMDSFSLEEQLVMLRTVLKRDQASKERDFERLMLAYLSEDSDRIMRMDDSITGQLLPAALWQRMRVKLIDERNLHMATVSVAKAAQQPVFIAVGAAHLAGQQGLVAAFKQAGFKLTRLKK